MKKSTILGTALLSAATVAAGIGMIALPHAYASWEEPLQQQLTSNILEQDTYYGSIEKDDSIYSYEMTYHATYDKSGYFFRIVGSVSDGVGGEFELPVTKISNNTYYYENGCCFNRSTTGGRINVMKGLSGTVTIQNNGSAVWNITNMFPYTLVLYTTTESVRGDINGNNMVDVSDAIAVLEYYAQQSAGKNAFFGNMQQENELIFALADVNQDNKITIQDAVLILTYYAKNASGMQPTWDDLIRSLS